MDKKLIHSLITEYKMPYAAARAVYSMKLRLLRKIPQAEVLFERKAEVKRIDLFSFHIKAIRNLLGGLSPADKKLLVETADAAAEGKIPGFSGMLLDYGNPIRWNYHPLTKKYCEMVKWYRIPDFDKERGDIKFIWEASRLTHFYYFARAYLLTGDRKYYQAFSSQMKAWVRDNPYSIGPNYKCGQECALRMINTLMAAGVFRQEGLLTGPDEVYIREIVRTSYKKIRSNFFYAYRCIKNNHTLSEIAGMIAGAWCCEDSRQVKKAFGYLEKTVSYQFTEDGGYLQHSVNYQRMAMQLLECIWKMNESIRYPLSDAFMGRFQAAVTLLYQIQSESGDLPNYGSNDGALIFPVTSCGYRDFRPFLNACSQALTGKGLYPEGKADEEALWFCGGINLRETKKRVSQAFYQAGIFSLRNADIHAVIYLNHYKSRPAHMDQLHLDLWYRDINVFCDSGTYSYADETGRNMVLTAAHNTLFVPGREQMSFQPPFFLYNWTRCRNILFNDSFFSGTMVSGNGYVHKREVRMEERTVILTDRAEGARDYELVFHTPCQARMEGRRRCYLFYEEKKIAEISISSGAMKVEEAGRSLYYGKLEKIAKIVVRPEEEKCRTKITLG